VFTVHDTDPMQATTENARSASPRIFAKPGNKAMREKSAVPLFPAARTMTDPMSATLTIPHPLGENLGKSNQ
jgi:hypothetical protein